MANIAMTGAQWGDEGKGKMVDILAPRFDYVIRFQGGHNAGHTVVFGGRKFALHLLPSGIFQKRSVNVIGNGVVVDPRALSAEIAQFRDQGFEINAHNLKISDRAHVLMPYHVLIDRFQDEKAAAKKIGTTGRGIGPAYEWKAGRRGIRFCDLADRGRLAALIEDQLEWCQTHYNHIPELNSLTTATILSQMEQPSEMLLPLVADTVSLLHQARIGGKSLLFEGAQGALLDVDFGTYPYVTSSNACSLGIAAGAGVPLSAVDHVVGIAKAYTTRVGQGPFPTELMDGDGEVLRTQGAEFGTTTGRPRRCGWLDLVALEYSHKLNNYRFLAIMKLDVLDGFEEIKICDGYLLDGERIQSFPASASALDRVEPHYRSVPGWGRSLTGIRDYQSLPREARQYLALIEESLGCPIAIVSVGPDRDQTIIVNQTLLDGIGSDIASLT